MRPTIRTGPPDTRCPAPKESLLAPQKFPAGGRQIPCSGRQGIGPRDVKIPTHTRRPTPPDGPNLQNSLLISLFSGNWGLRLVGARLEPLPAPATQPRGKDRNEHGRQPVPRDRV